MKRRCIKFLSQSTIPLLLASGTISALAASKSPVSSIQLAPSSQASASRQLENLALPERGEREDGQLFQISQTVEARDRLKSMDSRLDEKHRFNLDTQLDNRRYMQENHELALWYVKALVKGFFKGLLNDSKESYHEDREAARAQERTRFESQRAHERAMSRQPAMARKTLVEAEPEEKPGVISTVVMEAARFFDRFTDEGVSLALPVLSANFKLDTKNTVLETRLHSAILDMSMNYQVPFGESAKAFGKPLVEHTGEQMTVAGSRSFAEVGVSAGVSYEVNRQHLSCAVSKQVVGPLSAQVERQWGFEQGQGESSSASLNMSMTF